MTRWHLLLFNCISLLLTKVVTIEISCKKRKSQCSKFSAITTIRVRRFFKAPFFYSIQFIWNYLKDLRSEFIFSSHFFNQNVSARPNAREAKSGIIFISRLIERRFCTCDTPQRWHLFLLSRYRGHHLTSLFTPFPCTLNNLILLSVRWAMRTSRSQPQVRRRRGYEPNSRCGVCDKKNIKKSLSSARRPSRSGPRLLVCYFVSAACGFAFKTTGAWDFKWSL